MLVGIRQKEYSSLRLLLTEQEDVILVIFGFVDFRTLLRIQRACVLWNSLVRGLIPTILGCKKFTTTEELVDKIRMYCIVDNKLLYADELARTYGWPIGKWNVSQITNFRYAFEGRGNFNEDISEWDMSNATDLSFMFLNALRFNQDLSKWNTSNVTTMDSMFAGARSFNGHISSWDTSKVTSMGSMFHYAVSFNQDISSWNVVRAPHRDGMFEGAESFQVDYSPRFKWPW